MKRKILTALISAAFLLSGCNNESTNNKVDDNVGIINETNVLRFGTYYQWDVRENLIYIGNVVRVEISSSSFKIIEKNDSKPLTYQYKTKGNNLFLAHFTDEAVANKKEANEEVNQYFEYMFDFSDGFLKSKDGPSSKFAYLVTEDFAKELGIRILEYSRWYRLNFNCESLIGIVTKVTNND